MPRFQSNFFNWIDSSLPVKWGRQARRWLAMQQQSNPSADSNFKQKRQQAVELVTGLIASLAQTLQPRLRGQHSDQATSKRVKSNPVGDFGAEQTQLPGHHSLKQLAGSAIAALVKRVKAWLVGSRPADPDPDFIDPKPDYWLETPSAQPKQIPYFSRIKLKQDQLATNQSWWEEMQNLLRSAIAYFLAKDARSKKLSAIDHPLGVEGTDPAVGSSLSSSKNSVIARSESTQLDNWLDDWHDYDPARVVKLERNLPSSGDLTATSSPGQVSGQENSTSDLTKSRSPSTTIAEWTNLIDLQEQERVTDSPLHAWIETRSEFLGYAYDPIMAVVHWCDRWVAALERFCQKIFQAVVRYWRRLFQNLD